MNECKKEKKGRVCSKCEQEKPESEYSTVCDRIKKDGTRTLRLNRICKKCVNIWHREYKSDKRDSCNQKTNEWRESNPDKYRESKKKSDLKYSKTDSGKKIHKKATKKWVNENRDQANKTMRTCRDNIVDSYAVGLLVKRTKIDKEEIYKIPELIEVERLIIKTRRLIIKTKRL
jgi:hypothetical protein